MRNRFPETTNHLTETSSALVVPQDNQIVREPNQCPVCLDACPGTHKYLAKSKMLFDFLMEGLYPETLGIELHHFLFRHLQVVGYKKPFCPAHPRDKQCHQADLGQMDDYFGYLEPLLFGQTHGYEIQALGQVLDASLFAVDSDQAVLFESRHKDPTCLLDSPQDGCTGIPGIHQNGQCPLTKISHRFLQNFYGQLNLAFEGVGEAGFLGPIASDRPGETLSANFQNSGYGTQSFDQSFGGMMNTQSLDLFAVSLDRGIVQNEYCFGQMNLLEQGVLHRPGQFLNRLAGSGQEMMQTVGSFLPKDRGYLPNRTEFDEPDQTYQIDQKVDTLGDGQNLQEIPQIGRYIFGESFLHGFLLFSDVLGYIRNIGRKPFYLYMN
jgi:hypothetical protein